MGLQSASGRVWLKSVCLALLLGAMIGVLHYFEYLPPIIADILKAVASNTIDVLAILTPQDRLQSSPLAAAGTVAVSAAITGLLPLRAIMPTVWPEPTPILDQNITLQRKEAENPRAAEARLLGRDEELQHLMRFAGKQAGEGSCWMALTGAHGTGKSRLANAWLRKLRDLGWDVGYLADGVTAQEITHARLRRRRKTAIVVDEFSRRLDGTPALMALLDKPGRVRILVIDQLTPAFAPERDSAISARRTEKEYSPALALADLPNEILREINTAATDQLIQLAAGRPLYVLLGEDPASKLKARVEERLQGQTSTAAAYLAFAALAGPCRDYEPTTIFRESLDVNVRKRLHGIDDDSLQDNVVPMLTPDPLADVAVLQFLAKRGSGWWEPIARAAAEINPSAYFARLASLGAGPVADQYKAHAEQLLQLYIEHAPTHWHAREAEFAAACAQTPPDLPVIERMAQVRPLECDNQRAFAHAVCDAMRDYGAAGNFKALERWGERLLTLAQDPAWQKDQDIQLCLAWASFNAIDLYGKAAANATTDYGTEEAFDDLERWGERLLTLAQDPLWQTDGPIQLWLAEGARNAIYHYGEAKDFDDLERWGKRLLTLAQGPLWQTDGPIQLRLAKGAANAMADYGTAKDFGALERWGKRLLALAQDPMWRTDGPIQLRLAMGAAHAIYDYGEAKVFGALERWGKRLLALAQDPCWQTDGPIQLRLAMGAVNAINHYGKAAANATTDYGKARHFGALARWGERLLTLAQDPAWQKDQDIQLCLAKGAFNADLAYPAGHKSDFWRATLKHCAEQNPHNGEIVELATQANIPLTFGGDRRLPTL